MFDKENQRDFSKEKFQYPQSYEDDVLDDLDFDFYIEDVEDLSNSLNLQSKIQENQETYLEEESLDEIIDLDKIEENLSLETPQVLSYSEEPPTYFKDDTEDIEPLTEDSLDEILQKPLEGEEINSFVEEEVEEENSVSFATPRNFEDELDTDYQDPNTTVDSEFAKELEDDDTNVTLDENELDNILNADYSDAGVSDEITVPNSAEDLIFQQEVSNEDSIEVDYKETMEAPVLFNDDSDETEIEEHKTEDTEEISELEHEEEFEEEEEIEEDYGKSFFDSDEDIEEDFEIEDEDYDKEELQEETFGDTSSLFDAPTSLEGEITSLSEEEVEVSSFDEGIEEDESITLSPEELGNITSEEEVEPLPDYGLYETLQQDLANEVVGEERVLKTVTKQDLKKLMSYLDEKLGSMSEEFIEEFAKSEFFEIYKKIMNELEL